ncbi:hypothetical protein [Clostridium thermobutyricum]|nr:hypothetical protein [Clostridium thermobutyricum]
MKNGILYYELERRYKTFNVVILPDIKEENFITNKKDLKNILCLNMK